MTVETIAFSLDRSRATIPITVTTPAASVVRFGKIDYSNKAATARGYGLCVGQANSGCAPLVAGMTKAGMSVAMYKALVAKNGDAPGIATFLTWPTGAGTPYPGGLPTNYFLEDQAGQPQFSTAYNMWFMDFGLPAYQLAAVARAIQQAHQDGFDTIFVDGVDTRLGLGALKAGVTSSNSSNSAYVTALTSFIAYLCQQAHAAGLQAMLNIGGGAANAAQVALWQQWSLLADMVLEESFAITPTNWTVAEHQAYIAQQLANFQWCEQHGRLVMANQSNGGNAHATNVYGLALMLQVASGQSMWNTSNGSYGGAEFWWPEYDTAAALGAPLGPYSLSNGVYSRQFQHGTVTADTNTRMGKIS